MRGRPFEGRRIVVTRSPERAAGMIAEIEALGGQALSFPSIAIDRDGAFPDFEEAMRRLEDYDFVVVTSANVAKALAETRSDLQGPSYIAIGDATAEALEALGLKVFARPEEAVSERIAGLMGEVEGKRVLIPGSDIARGLAAEELRGLGAAVDEVVAYRTKPGEGEAQALAEIRKGVDALLFTSPSTAVNFRALFGGTAGAGTATVACIGPITAAKARDLGFRVDVVARKQSVAGLLSALADFWNDAVEGSDGASSADDSRRYAMNYDDTYSTGSAPVLVSKPRRLRLGAGLRGMVRETRLSADDLIYPLFVTHGKGLRREIASMPGVFQLSVDMLAAEALEVAALGIPAVILFGIPATKDEFGSESFAADGIVQLAIREIKRAAPELVVVTDVCLCEYTESGHCGLLHHRDPVGEPGQAGLPEGYVLNDETLPLLAKTAVSHARAGADLVAPSGMMDGMVGAIRRALDAAGYSHLPILSYSVKYASGFYGPFRDAANGAPSFGDRTSHQMDPANVREALREARLDVAEGADMLMVKPALAYLDVIRQTRDLVPELPLVAYNVSGEYAMVKAGALRGWIDERRVTLEILLGMKRAGADLIISYHAKDAARWLAETDR